MSVHASEAFLRVMHDTPEVAQQLKATTGIQEVVRLGHRHGFDFTEGDFREASTVFRPSGAASAPVKSLSKPRNTTFLHHEYSLDEVEGFEPVLAELPRLKVKPPTVDLAEFDRSYRPDDASSTNRSPSDPAYQEWHRAMKQGSWLDPEGVKRQVRRDFHLVNLDETIEYPGYDAYFDAKTRTVAALEKLFGTEIRFSGSMWYPPHSYRLWHTNEDQPGWRMYVVDVDRPFENGHDTSFFRYQNPQTGQIVTLHEKPRIVRFFKAEQDPDRLFWHCIVNPTDRHRWSFGFVVPDDWQDKIRIRS
ncbi:Nif11-like leader peptide family natural product precursor [Kineosporia sp. NBRC 101731]|uniref:Nif11-like leader peptide family natural product precursor n=1 Tax=Kineosporia sp. NBRC 101731 TaxID=3032199 RepID=UPI0024A41ACD|nr:Nif11-like leader peptide family natural product precursor [Kineosporia sp. NBRC 101731]GLY28766.1 hypothetical protein Kisp02_21310 [Kineosporia sp. NBRC 101731]